MNFPKVREARYAEAPCMSRRQPIARLALIPATALSVAIPLVNRLEPRILGLPFLVAWIVLWWLLTPIFLWIVYRRMTPAVVKPAIGLSTYGVRRVTGVALDQARAAQRFADALAGLVVRAAP